MEIEARAIAQSFTTVTEAMDSSKAGPVIFQATVQILMLREYLEAQTKFAGNNSTKVLLFPTKDTVHLTYGGLKDMLR